MLKHIQRRENESGEGSAATSCMRKSWGSWRCLAFEKRRLRWDFIAFYKYPKRGCSKVSSGRTGRNGSKLHQGRFRLHIRKHLFTESIAKHWSRVYEELSHHPWRYLRVVLIWCFGTQFSGGFSSVRLMVGLNDLRGLFQPKYFYDSMVSSSKIPTQVRLLLFLSEVLFIFKVDSSSHSGIQKG